MISRKLTDQKIQCGPSRRKGISRWWSDNFSWWNGKLRWWNARHRWRDAVPPRSFRLNVTTGLSPLFVLRYPMLFLLYMYTDRYVRLCIEQRVASDGLAGQEDKHQVSVLSGAVPGPHVCDRHPTHSYLLRDRSNHSVYSSLAAHACLVLAAARDPRQNTPRYSTC